MNKFIKPFYKTTIHKSYGLQLTPKDRAHTEKQTISFLLVGKSWVSTLFTEPGLCTVDA